MRREIFGGSFLSDLDFDLLGKRKQVRVFVERRKMFARYERKGFLFHCFLFLNLWTCTDMAAVFLGAAPFPSYLAFGSLSLSSGWDFRPYMLGLDDTFWGY